MANQQVKYTITGENLLSKVLKQVDTDAQKAEDSVKKVGSGNASSSGGLMGSIVGANLLTGAIKSAGSAVYNFGKDSINAYAKQESFLVSLKTMFHGNAMEAEVLNGQLQRFAKETPFELTEIQDATKMMIAYGSSSSSVVKEMTMLGDISSGVGSSLSEVGYLYGTLRTQGRAFSKDIYQFTGRGIPIVKELAKQFGVAESKVMGLVEKGKVGFPEIEKAFKSMTAEGGQFFNMMKEQSNTISGQTSNLSDAWDQLKSSIGESQSGILKNTIAWASNMVNSMANTMKFENFFDENLSKNKEAQYGTFSGYEDDRDKRFALQGANGMFSNFQKQGGTVKTEFGNQSLTPVGGREQAETFSNLIFEKINNLKPENAQNQLNEFIQIQRNLKTQRDAGEMSNKLFVNEMLNLSKGMQTANQLVKGTFKKDPNATGLTGTGTTKTDKMGTGVTIEAQVPKNQYITINGGLVHEMKIESMDGSTPVAQIKEQISTTLVELLNDAYQAMR